MWGVQWDIFAVEAKQSVMRIIPLTLPWSLPPLPPCLVFSFIPSSAPLSHLPQCFPAPPVAILAQAIFVKYTAYTEIAVSLVQH